MSNIRALIAAAAIVFGAATATTFVDQPAEALAGTCHYVSYSNAASVHCHTGNASNYYRVAIVCVWPSGGGAVQLVGSWKTPAATSYKACPSGKIQDGYGVQRVDL